MAKKKKIKKKDLTVFKGVGAIASFKIGVREPLSTINIDQPKKENNSGINNVTKLPIL